MRLIRLILAASLALAPNTAEAQQAGKVYRIGQLSPASELTPMDMVFERSLRDLGYINGQNLRFERRHLAGRNDFTAAARELIQMNVDVIVTWGGVAPVIVSGMTNTIPIVFLAGPSVETGLVAGLARPGSNITGVTFHASKQLTPKHLEILKEIVPKLSYAGILHVPKEDPQGADEETAGAARALGIRLLFLPLQRPEDLDDAFGRIEKLKPQGLIAAPSGLLYTHREKFFSFAAKHRLPIVYGLREVMTDGGLISYSPSLSDIAARGAHFVDRILKGAKPGDLPVEQPTKFELVINLKTAKALGLTIPHSLLLRVDQVIQ